LLLFVVCCLLFVVIFLSFLSFAHSHFSLVAPVRLNIITILH
jgi:hypothetical protein